MTTTTGNLAAICCSKRLRVIDIQQSHLKFTYCSGCEHTNWYANGRKVERSDALDVMSVTGNTGLGGRTSHAVAREHRA